MNVAMSLGIAGFNLPLSNTGTMVFRREESKTPFRAHLGCRWSSFYELAYPRRHQDVRRQGHMVAATSQQETPWTVAEGSIPMQQMQEEGCWKHKDRTKLQAQADPLVMKATLETRAMRWRCNMNIAWRQRMEKKRSFMCWSSNSRKNRSCIDERMSCSGKRYSTGRNMHSRMKLRLYKL